MTHSYPVIRFQSVQYAVKWWQNQLGLCVNNRPKSPSMHGIHLTEQALIDRACKLNYLDRWTFHCKFILTANKSLTFQGAKAKQMWKNWNEFIFGM